MTPGSCFTRGRNPLLSNTFTIGVLSGRTSAVSSRSPAARAIAREMAHQCQPDTLPLVFVDNGECHLGLSRLQDDVASAAHDHRPPVIFNHGDQSHMIDEVDVQEERLSAKKRR
jgi:hypothetical protein